MAAAAQAAHLHTDVEAVLDNLVAHMRLGFVLVGGHELVRVQVHVQADEPVAQLEARHERVRREEAGRRIVCSMHASLCLRTVERWSQRSVSRTAWADRHVLVSQKQSLTSAMEL